MRKFLGLIIILVIGFAAYSVLSDPERREKVLGTIEGSTGVNLTRNPDKLIEDAGRAVGEGAQKLLKDLGETLSDPDFQRSLKKWGENALDSLDEGDLRRLKRDLERSAGSSDYDEILEKYLTGSGDS